MCEDSGIFIIYVLMTWDIGIFPFTMTSRDNK